VWVLHRASHQDQAVKAGHHPANGAAALAAAVRLLSRLGQMS